MSVRQPTLEELALHSRAIAAAWWFCFLGGPVWTVALIAARRRRARH